MDAAGAKDTEVIGDLVEEIAFSQSFSVKYGDIAVNMGNEVTPTQAAEAPTVSFDGEAGTFYTVVMTDPDAPSRENPQFREFKVCVTHQPTNQPFRGCNPFVPHANNSPTQHSTGWLATLRAMTSLRVRC